MRKHNKTTTLFTLAASTTAIMHLANKSIENTAQIDNLLSKAERHSYQWRLGEISYVKKGQGDPIILIHDLLPGGSAYEWNHILDDIAKERTVYCIDLLGCGLSEKPGICYTSFMYVQMMGDFIKNVVGGPVDVVTSGASASFTIMTSVMNKDLIKKIICINPPCNHKTPKISTERTKVLRKLLQIPVFGTLLYYMLVSRENVNNMFIEKMFFNPFHVDEKQICAYYEAAHKGGYFKKYFYASYICGHLNVDVSNAVKNMENDLYIILGKEDHNCPDIKKEYGELNSSIHISEISKCTRLPHVENAADTIRVLREILN